MKDTIIKGTGNSRSIKSVPNLAALAPTWEKALELLTGEGLPVDIEPLNLAGVDVQGTELNKANLLTDSTETSIWGNVGNRSVNNALAKLRSLITDLQKSVNLRPIYETGYYNGTDGSSVTIHCANPPLALSIYNESTGAGLDAAPFVFNCMPNGSGTSGAMNMFYGNYGNSQYMAWYANEKRITFNVPGSNSAMSKCLNKSGYIYRYFILEIAN